MKYCIMKGAEGFGDRLQCLLYALEYCKITNRTLVIDWRDQHWTQGKYYHINNYIKIKNIPTIDIEVFLKQKYTNTLTVYKKSWNKVLEDYNFLTYARKEKFCLDDENRVLRNIISGKRKDFEEDVVVYTGVYFRCWKYNYIKNVLFSDKVYELVNQQYQKLGLSKNKYICVHIRATSKEWEGAKNIKQSLLKRINNQFPNELSYFDYLYKQLKNIKNNIPILHISDCPKTLKRWKNFYGKGFFLELEGIETNKQSGIHLVNLNTNKNITKYQLNLLTLRDFCLMKDAAYIVSDGISLFSQMAKQFSYDKS